MKIKNNKTPAVVFAVVSVGCYVAAALGFFKVIDRSMSVTLMCLGSCFLCLSTVFINKDKKENNDEGQDSDKESQE